MGWFTSPSLQFNSTFGAALKGAAQAGNQIIEDQRKQEGQQDLLAQTWAYKVDQGINARNKENKSLLQDKNMWTNFYQMAGGDTNANTASYLADQAYNIYKANPRAIGDAYNALNSALAKGNVISPQGYHSTTMQDIQNNMDTNYQNSRNEIGRIPPKFQGTIGAPYSGGVSPDLTGQHNYSGPDIGQIPQQNTASSTGQIPSQQNTASQTTTQQPPLQQEAQDTSRPTVLTVPNRNADYQQQMLQMQRDKLALAKATANDKGYNKTLDDYVNNPKDGLMHRYSELAGLQSSQFDINSAMDILNRGFSSSALQPMKDEFNRYLSSIFGSDLTSVLRDSGIDVNSIQDTNTLKKDIANGIIDKLKTLHFGRITNYEANMVKQGFTGSGNDPNTNIKITLMLKASIDQAMKAALAEHDAVFTSDGGYHPRAGLDLRGQLMKQYANQNAPWPQFDSRTMDGAAIDRFMQESLSTGNDWVEDKATGKMWATQPPGVDKTGSRTPPPPTQAP